MNTTNCEHVRELIPDMAAGRVDPGDTGIDEHLAACVECREELDLARMLWGGREVAPPGLAGAVIMAVRRDRRAPNRSWWGLSAAAVAALAIGIGISSDAGVVLTATPEYATELEEGELWLSDDGLLAGAPALDDLSDEALEALLDELALGGAGGSV